MNLILSLSLEQRSLANIAIALWSQDDIRVLMSKSVLYTLHENWREIKNAVVKRSFNLQLPEKLQEKLLNFIVRVGVQILLWIDIHCKQHGLVKEFPDTLVWTSLGTIDNITTAKILIMGGTLDGNASFKLASMYCLEDEIKYCWNTFYRSFYSDKCNSGKCLGYWPNYMKEFDAHGLNMDSSKVAPYWSAVFGSIMRGTEEATRYFFQKANMEHSDFVVSLVRNASEWCCTTNFFSLNRYSRLMMFLLSQMNSEQQIEIFKSHTYAIIKSLLIWPYQSLFLEVAKDKWEFLSKKNYHDLLFDMVNLMDYDHDLHKLFREFWNQSPETYKHFVTCGGELKHLILNLLEKESPENIRLILKDKVN